MNYVYMLSDWLSGLLYTEKVWSGLWKSKSAVHGASVDMVQRALQQLRRIYHACERTRPWNLPETRARCPREGSLCLFPCGHIPVSLLTPRSLLSALKHSSFRRVPVASGYLSLQTVLTSSAFLLLPSTDQIQSHESKKRPKAQSSFTDVCFLFNSIFHCFYISVSTP